MSLCMYIYICQIYPIDNVRCSKLKAKGAKAEEFRKGGKKNNYIYFKAAGNTRCIPDRNMDLLTEKICPHPSVLYRLKLTTNIADVKAVRKFNAMIKDSICYIAAG